MTAFPLSSIILEASSSESIVTVPPGDPAVIPVVTTSPLLYVVLFIVAESWLSIAAASVKNTNTS